MKTIREWLNELPDEIRDRAIRNGENDIPCTLDETASNMPNALWRAFTWSDTPELGVFWAEWYKWLQDPSLPKPTIQPADELVPDPSIEFKEKTDPVDLERIWLIPDTLPNPSTGGDLTKRERFAMAAMQGTNMEAYANAFGNQWAIHVAKDAVIMADALIAELEKQKP
jgi:hypothetical protein